MQESMNKDLEELKNKHTSNTITEIKNTLEGVNIRISEPEEQTSELENKVVEIIAEKKNKEKKEWKELKIVSETTGIILITLRSNYRVPGEEEEKN